MGNRGMNSSADGCPSLPASTSTETATATATAPP